MTTRSIMLWAIGALLPGLAAFTWLHGPGVLANAAGLVALCMLVEASCVAIKRGRGLRDAWQTTADGSAALTGLLIAICLPPYVDVIVLLVAAIASIGIAKHAYGGLGQNTFNPAMVGYAVILVSYPEALAAWPTQSAIDGLSGATLLTQFRYREALTTAEFAMRYAVDTRATDVVAIAFLAGGLLLVYKRIIAWRIPLAVLATVALCAIIGYDQGSSSSHGTIWFHCATGGLMAAAFFVATDPVTHPMRANHQIVFGILIGLMVFWIRAQGSYPDGIAFAVLLANCATPFLNRRHLQEGARIA
jgi:electron transport complex protein RnfD